MKWIELDNSDQLEQINQESMTRAVVLFKHSTRCYISKMALRQFEQQSNFDTQINCYLLHLVEHRKVSDAVTQFWGIPHESPQILVIHQGKVLHHASHEAIDAKNVEKWIGHQP